MSPGSRLPIIQNINPRRLENQDFEQLRKRVISGEIFVFRRALQEFNCLEPMIETSLEGIRRAVGSEAAGKVRQLGFEKIHEVIKGDVIFDVMHATYPLYRERARALIEPIVQQLFGAKPFYYEESPNVRFHIPYDNSKTLEKIDDFQWSGKLVPHGPHHDSWYYCPTNCVDIWIALGRIIKGNGLSIFPEVFGKYIPCDDKGLVRRDQRFGVPENFDMEAGDVLVFSGEHFHSSELNSTDTTRHVVSFRCTFESPIFFGNSPDKYNYRIAGAGKDKIRRIKERIWEAKNRLFRHMDERLGRINKTRFVATPSELPGSDGIVHGPAIDPSLRQALEKTDITFERVSDLLKLNPYSVKAVSSALCAARTLDEIVLFSRYCPHQGGDLSAGYVEGVSVFCPWHNLPIDLRTGKSPCRTLREIKVLRRWTTRDQHHLTQRQ